MSVSTQLTHTLKPLRENFKISFHALSLRFSYTLHLFVNLLVLKGH